MRVTYPPPKWWDEMPPFYLVQKLTVMSHTHTQDTVLVLAHSFAISFQSSGDFLKSLIEKPAGSVLVVTDCFDRLSLQHLISKHFVLLI